MLLVLAKAMEDRACCVLVMAVTIIAQHWRKLLAASVLSPLAYPEGFLRIRHPLPALLHVGTYRPSELAIFACDLSYLSPRDGRPPCLGVRFRRPRPPFCSPADISNLPCE